MQVKIDTKEKFHVITPMEAILSATMADEVKELLGAYLHYKVKNIVLDLTNITEIDEEIASQLLHLQREFYEKSASFVTCCLQEPVEAFLAERELLELLNAAPTQSEAADIVQMEEIERELLDEDMLD